VSIFSAVAPLLLATASTPSAECTDIPGWEQVIANPEVRWVVIGEIHGTNEIPAIFADAVRQAANSRPVVIALELPSPDQHAIDAFINSDGGGAAKTDFLAAQMWNSPTKDGRSSEAMFRLFEVLREMKSKGRVRSVVAIAPSLFAGVTTMEEAEEIAARFNQADYEKDMAKLVEAAAQPGAIVLTLTGGVHASRARLAGLDFVGMAGHLPQEATLTFNIQSNGGQSWTCEGQPMVCGPHVNMNVGGNQPRGLQFGVGNPAFSGVLHLGTTITASPPQQNPAVPNAEGKAAASNLPSD